MTTDRMECTESFDEYFITLIHDIAFMGQPSFQAMGCGQQGSECVLFAEVHPDKRALIKETAHFFIRRGFFLEAGQRTRFERVEFL